MMMPFRDNHLSTGREFGTCPHPNRVIEVCVKTPEKRKTPGREMSALAGDFESPLGFLVFG